VVAELSTAGAGGAPTTTSTVDADGILVTTPAPAAARLVGVLAPEAARLLGTIEYSSVVLVSFAYDPGAVPRPLDASGFLVPRSAGMLMTACSWASSKFAHLGRDELVRLRVSAGRWGDERWLALAPGDLVAELRRDLATTMGIAADPLQVRVSPWPAGLPQYTVGHLDRLAAIEADLDAGAPAVSVTGAAFRGVGLPACIDQGRSAARQMLTRLG
jgi:oxygen-dependent protoporphyrinogen oxidase